MELLHSGESVLSGLTASVSPHVVRTEQEVMWLTGCHVVCHEKREWSEDTSCSVNPASPSMASHSQGEAVLHQEPAHPPPPP